jgi:hypothetical protein
MAFLFLIVLAKLQFKNLFVLLACDVTPLNTYIFIILIFLWIFGKLVSFFLLVYILIAPQNFKLVAFPIFSILSVPNEGYSNSKFDTYVVI